MSMVIGEASQRDHSGNDHEDNVDRTPGIAQLGIRNDFENHQVEDNQGQLEGKAKSKLEVDDDVDPRLGIGEDVRKAVGLVGQPTAPQDSGSGRSRTRYRR